MTIPERCFTCVHWEGKCKRVIKVKMLIAQGGGDLDIQTQPGLVPDYLEDEMTKWLLDAITQAVDSWPGWKEIQSLQEKEKDKAECGARDKRPEDFLKVVPLK